MNFIHYTAEVKGIIGDGTKVWNHAQIRDGAMIGRNCIIGKNVYIDSDVKIGDNCKIQNNVSIYNAEIKNDVFIGPNAVFTNDLYPRAFIWNNQRKAKKTIIETGASVGAGSVLIAGIKIGEFAMVGCGSVVTKDVDSYCLVYGNPATFRKKINKEGKSK